MINFKKIKKDVKIIDDNYNIVSEYVYDAYGKCYITKNINDVANINPIRYRSYYYDKGTGLYYLNNRYYDPDTMRFISMDDISYLNYQVLGGLNLFTYCNNNPVMYSDGDGNFPILAFILGISALVGIGLTIGGVASDNSALKSIGLSMVAISALISGGIAVAAGIGGATLTGIVGGVTVAAGLGTATFATAEYQQMFTGNNWMLDAGMSKDLYNGLMIATASIATFGTIASSFCSAFNIKSISQFGKFGDYYGMKFKTGAGKIRVLSLHTHGHRVKHGIRSIFEWHWQLQKWDGFKNQTAGTIARWLIWTLTRI